MNDYAEPWFYRVSSGYVDVEDLKCLVEDYFTAMDACNVMPEELEAQLQWFKSRNDNYKKWKEAEKQLREVIK